MVKEGKLIPLRRVDGSVDQLSDRALMSAVAEGDRAALGALYDRFYPDVGRFIARLTQGSSLDPADLVQNTFLEAYRSAPRFRGTSAVKTWLFGIASNLTRDAFRRLGRHAKALEVLESIPGKRAATEPPEALERERRRERLAGAIAKLPPALKEAYATCIQEEVPIKEASKILRVREASLYRRLHDAREALKKALSEGTP